MLRVTVRIAKRRGWVSTAFAARLSARRPELASQVHSITKLYMALRYSPHHTRSMLARLRSVVQRFQP